MSDMSEITEEKIFHTLGRGVPICTLLNEVDANTIKSMSTIEQVIKQIPQKDKEQIRGLEIVHERQKLNLDEIRSIRKNVGCK